MTNLRPTTINAPTQRSSPIPLRRLALIGLCLTYSVTLERAYILTIAPQFAYAGLDYRLLPLFVTLLAHLMATIPSLWLPLTLRAPSQVCYWILYLTIISPSMWLPYHVMHRTPASIYPLPVSLLSMFILLGLFYRLPVVRLQRLSVRPRTVILTLIALALMLTAIVGYKSGSLIPHVSLADLYNRRMESREAVGSSTVASYLIALLSGTICPVLIAVGVARNNKAVVAVGIAASVYIFSLDGTKSSLAMPLLLLFLVWLVMQKRRTFGLWMIGSAIAVVAFAVLEHTIRGESLLSTYMVRRQFIVPSQLTSYYWEFFHEHSPTFFTDNAPLRWLITPQYNMPAPRLIGWVYFEDADVNANANLWAAAFAGGGYIAMFITTMATGVILRCLDSFADAVDLPLIGALCGWFGFIWSNQALHTSLLSNGVLATFIVLLLLRRSSRPAAPGVQSMARRADIVVGCAKIT